VPDADLDVLAEALTRLQHDAEAVATAAEDLAAVELRALKLDLPRHRLGLHELLAAVAVDLQAITMLRNGLPYARQFPDGRPAPGRPTSRQLVYLAKLADAEFARQVGPASGMAPGYRRCTATKADGQPCTAFALRWTERAVCAAHATGDERASNQRANAECHAASADRGDDHAATAH